MSAITALFLSSLTYTLAPVPPDSPPDPMARGYVGIRFGTGSLTIESVEANLPAAKAGLKAGDVILRIGTLQPHNFDQLVAHVCSFRPGAVVEIEVQRGTQRKTFKVKLGSRPADLDQPRLTPIPLPIEDR